jgi:hypothetical protein
VLQVVNVEEGSFLKSGGGTIFSPTIDSTAGAVTVACALLGNVTENVPGVNGTGTLTNIVFSVIANRDCALDLYGTELVNSAEGTIPHTVIGGYFNAVP